MQNYYVKCKNKVNDIQPSTVLLHSTNYTNNTDSNEKCKTSKPHVWRAIV